MIALLHTDHKQHSCTILGCFVDMFSAVEEVSRLRDSGFYNAVTIYEFDTEYQLTIKVLAIEEYLRK